MSGKVIEFKVPGQPVGKQRPKFRRTGNFVQTYTPEKTVNYENLVKIKAQEKMKEDDLLVRPLSLILMIFCSIPESWSNKKKKSALEGSLRPTTKPDADNVTKIICDALNKIVYKDDSQIVEVSASKYYAEIPGVHVVIEEL